VERPGVEKRSGFKLLPSVFNIHFVMFLSCNSMKLVILDIPLIQVVRKLIIVIRKKTNSDRGLFCYGSKGSAVESPLIYSIL